MEPTPNTLGYKHSLLIFGTAALLLFIVTHVGIEILYDATGIRKVLLWFINGGLFIFIPMLLLAIFFAKKQTGNATLKQALIFLRVKPLKARELLATIIGLVIIFALSGLFYKILPLLIPNFNPQLPFLTMKPLHSGEYWILICWIPLFILNILGEELFWRGLLMPHQETAMGKNTWWFHGLCWLVFHIPFGFNMILLLLPIFFIQSYLVWKYKNTSIGIIIHGVYNGTGFIIVALGLI
jgi:membrane protease YdiL (CAAX protease family)